MVRSTFFDLGFLLGGAATVSAGNLLPRNIFSEDCQEIATAISPASQVFGAPSLQYSKDIYHWASSSTQNAACSFEPGVAEDVGIALQILGKTKTPFAVKGGGHATNPGFSSTEGVQIAMYRFSEVVYDPAAQTASIGAGLNWDDVYAALEPHGVNVVGGRVTGVGVAGFTLGGGYSWLTNQYGLTIDTVQAFELVMPNGTVTNVTETSSPDLFFALRGGFNNFGIVTKFTLKTFPQTQVWGGVIMFTANTLDQVNSATANFATYNSDPKASMIVTYNFLLGEPGATVIIFYDAPQPPPGLFADFLAIPFLTKDISTRSFLSLVQSSPANATAGQRTTFNTVSVTGYPISLLESIVNESVYWGEALALASADFISYDVEPFLPTLFNYSSTPSAYPASRSQPLLPLNIIFSWTLPTSDEYVQDAIRTSANTLRAKAIVGGQTEIQDATVYGNYAIFDTPVENIYGDNLGRLQSIKAAVDPDDVMGLAGGFKV
ncbi:hypothetical protein F5I97DRAFT_1120742 [Phlebopus sp. FC_14]|nr:hypothetical protein F5I97DRAFT_1120742 [Phlebopus sp. FC_14]